MRELISLWAKHLKAFYDYKKMCGYKYDKCESVIYLFDRHYYSLGLTELKFSRDVIEPFLELKPNERIGNQIGKATILRQFGKYLFINDVINDIYIIPTITKKGEKEFIPYIFSNQEYKNIINYLESYTTPTIPGGFKAFDNAINSVTISLKILMSTGMRLGEALNLKLNNINFDENYFLILEAKNNNQRIVPFSNTLREEIKKYIIKSSFIIGKDDFLLQSKQNTRLTKSIIRNYYYKALFSVGIKNKKGKGPRIHDFRHTFAVMSLTQMQKQTDDINLSLIYLSTYLGHKSLRETQKYIWMTPELFKDIKVKMENYTSFIKLIFDEGEKYYE